MMFVAKTDEHDEFGHDLSDMLSGLKDAVKLREKMQEKRMKKLDQIAKEMTPPELFGPDHADLTIVSWGSTANPVREALRRLSGEGLRVNSLEFTQLYPLNVAEVTKALKSCNALLNIEGNYTAQFAGLLKKETGVAIDAELPEVQRRAHLPRGGRRRGPSRPRKGGAGPCITPRPSRATSRPTGAPAAATSASWPRSRTP